VRVLFLSQIVPYPPHGGVLQRGYNLLREIGRHASVHVLAFVHPDTLPTESARNESETALRRFCEYVEYFPLWAKASPLHRGAALLASACSSRPFSTIAHRSAAFKRRVAEAIGSGQFDIVHVDTLALSQFVIDRGGLPAVLTHHNIESMLMSRRAQVETHPFAKAFLRREALKLAEYERLASPAFDINILVSAVDEKVLQNSIPGLRTAVVPNGVDVEYFSPSPSPDARALIYTGGMNMFANRDAVMHFLNETWPLIKAKAPDVRFFAIGQDPPKELVAFAARDPHVVMTGFVDDVRPYVRQSAVYVVPLRVGGGTRLKVLDAMAMGMPLVSTAIGCEGLDVTPGEHLVVADTPEAFAGGTLALLADPARRLALGRAARALVERRYSWHVVGRQLVDVYFDALAATGRAR
jgi:sugar transferase (PEP-CTERM/EpsH1 system associated)